ncbi:MAG: tRNA pseudouridine(55) synthase TruB [Phycisphaerae bacterium]|nr:tRNA pseudouridine(55) synthase TruB [Phycisphaerae bacterium]
MSRSNNSQTGINGFIVLDKPSNMSSMKAIAILRRKAGRPKTGHAGTLDPLATGVLVCALGKATKSISRMMNTTKRYRTMIDLSSFTSTDDLEGEPEPVTPNEVPTRSRLEAALEGFTGSFLQRPPAFSAMKVGGRRAYQLARSGEEVVLEPRPVMVHEMTVLGYEWPVVELELLVDKGFYVRSLARELGMRLGTGGHCTSIRRTAVGPFTLDGAQDPDTLPDPLPPEMVLGIDDAIALLDA